MASKKTCHNSSSDKEHLQQQQHHHVSKRIKHCNTQQEQQQQLSFPATNHTFAFYFEPMFRKVMQEVLPPMLHRHLTPSCGLSLNKVGKRHLQLCFMNKLPQRIFTKSMLKAEGGELLQIELRDAENRQRVVNDEASKLKIQICVLYGDFAKEDWTAEEFTQQIVIPRKDKGELLNRNEVLTLKNGVAYINKNIEFTDISKGRTKTFRLGAKIVQSSSIATYIREGRSDPFKVLDRRGEAYQKFDHLSLDDEISRLKGIGGKLYKQLASDGIKTVKDFLQMYISNEASLREKICKIGGKWNTIIEHAKNCDVENDEQYIYYATEQPISSLVFNSIYEVVEVTFSNEQQSRSIQSLTLQEKLLVERVKQHAYKNLNDLKPLPVDTATYGLVETSIDVQNAQYGDQDHYIQQLEFPFALQGQKETEPNFVEPSTSTSYVNEGTNYSQIYDDPVTITREIPETDNVGGDIYIEDDNYGAHFSDVPDGYLIDNCHIYTAWEQENIISFGFSDVNFINPAMDISSSSWNGKPKPVWCRILAVIKWGVRVRRFAASKRNY